MRRMLATEVHRWLISDCNGRATPAERRVPRERARETEIGRNPSPLGHLAAESVPLGNSRGSCLDGLSRKRPKEKEAGGPCRPRAVSRQNPSPSATLTAACPAECHGIVRGRRKSGGIRRPWDTSWQNPSPSAAPAAPALRAAQNPWNASAPAPRVPLSCNA